MSEGFFRGPGPELAARSVHGSVPIGRPSVDAQLRADMRVDKLDLGIITELLEELDTGVIVCSEEGRVVFANDAARRELSRGGPLALDSMGVLQVPTGGRTSSIQWRNALRCAIQSQRRQLLPIHDERHTLLASVMPLGSSSRPWALVLLGRRRLAPDLAVEMLGKLYDLTHAERSVLAGLLDGQAIEALARTREVKISTLRTQVASLRAKMGVRRVVDLIRLASELPPMTGALHSPALCSPSAMATHAPASNAAVQAA